MNSLGSMLSLTAYHYKQSSFRQPSHTLVIGPLCSANHWDSSTCQKKLRILVSQGVVWACDGLVLTTVRYKRSRHDDNYNNDEVNQRLLQHHANFPFHRACSSQHRCHSSRLTIEDCFQEQPRNWTRYGGWQPQSPTNDGCAYSMYQSILMLLVMPSVICAYLQLAPEAADQQDSDGMTPFQYLLKNELTFVGERNASSLTAWWYI